MNTLQSLNTAMDEYVAAMVEAHGSCQATRDEARERMWDLHDEAVRLSAEECDDTLDDPQYTREECRVISAAWDHAQAMAVAA